MSKTLQGHRTQLNTTKKTEAPTVSSRGQTTVMQYNHDRLIIVKRRRQRRCIADGRRQAVPRTCRSHWEGTVVEH